MSRIGKLPINLPAGVSVTVNKDNSVTVKGPKGELKRELNKLVTVNIVDNIVTVDVEKKEDKKERSLWGTFSAHVKNMVKGVSVGFEKKLELIGVGYKASMQPEKKLRIDVGYSHPIDIDVPEGLTVVTEKNFITVSGIDKQKVGEFTAKIRSNRKPEPYKGKGIKYEGEKIRRKEGKKAAK